MLLLLLISQVRDTKHVVRNHSIENPCKNAPNQVNKSQPSVKHHQVRGRQPFNGEPAVSEVVRGGRAPWFNRLVPVPLTGLTLQSRAPHAGVCRLCSLIVRHSSMLMLSLRGHSRELICGVVM